MAYHLGHKAFAVVRADPTRTVLLSIVVLKEWRRQGFGSRLLRRLQSLHPNLMTYMVLDGAIHAFFEAQGWELQPLNLYEMVLPLQ